MAIDPTIVGLSIGGVVLFILFLLISGSPFLSVIVVSILLGILVYVLNLMGVISIKTKDNKLDIKFMESVPAPTPTKTILTEDTKGSPLQQKEVFYISGNYYTYDEAPAVCAAYESELASYDQIMQAYSSGAEWCGYGWSAGGMALYPTQQSTWDSLMKEPDESKRTQCGRPGVNGGYFDPNTKMGVNCYGIKPGDKETHYPIPVPGTDKLQFDGLVQKFKSMTGSIDISPFNRSGWSIWGLGSHTPTINVPTVNK